MSGGISPSVTCGDSSLVRVSLYKEGVRKMNGIIITALLLVGLVGGVALIDSCKPLWKWIEKQQWWKEIVE